MPLITTNETFERIQNCIIKVNGTDRSAIEKQTRLREDLGFDSLDIVEVVMNLEKEFNIQIPDDNMNFSTVLEIMDYLITLGIY